MFLHQQVSATMDIVQNKNGQQVTVAEKGERGIIKSSISTNAGKKHLVDFGSVLAWVWEDRLHPVV